MNTTTRDSNPAEDSKLTVSQESERPAAAKHVLFNRPMLITLLLLGLMILFRILRPVFLDQDLVLFPLVRDISIFTVVGLSQMMALSLGHMNLAVGRMAGFGAMFMGMSFDLLHLLLKILPLGMKHQTKMNVYLLQRLHCECR